MPIGKDKIIIREQYTILLKYSSWNNWMNNLLDEYGCNKCPWITKSFAGIVEHIRTNCESKIHRFTKGDVPCNPILNNRFT